MRTALGVVLVVVFACPRVEAGCSKDAQKFRSFVIEKYLQRQVHDDRTNRFESAALPHVKRYPEPPQGERARYLIANQGNPRYFEARLRAAGYKLAKLYGYALSNQRLKTRPGTQEMARLNQMEKTIVPELLHELALSMREKKPTADFLGALNTGKLGVRSEKRIYDRLLIDFKNAAAGEHDSDMKRLTGVSPDKAPDLFGSTAPTPRRNEPTPTPRRAEPTPTPPRAVPAPTHPVQSVPLSEDAKRLRAFVLYGYLGALSKNFVDSGGQFTERDEDDKERVLIAHRHGRFTDNVAMVRQISLATYTVAKLYGYAMGNQWRTTKPNTLEAAALKHMQKCIVSQLLKKFAYGMRLRPAGARSPQQLHSTLTRYFENGMRGEYDEDMASLTGVTTKTAPDLFDFLLAPKLFGRWLWVDTNGDGRLVGQWNLTRKMGKRGRVAYNTATRAQREWVMRGFNILWMRPNGFIEAAFVTMGDEHLGRHLSNQERKRIAEGTWLPSHTMGQQQWNQRLQRALDPRAIIGVWGEKGNRWGTTPGKLSLTIAADPRTPGLYIARFTGTVTPEIRRSYPDGLQFARLQYLEAETLKGHCLHYHVTSYSNYNRERGYNPWVSKGWVRLSKTGSSTTLGGPGLHRSLTKLAPLRR